MSEPPPSQAPANQQPAAPGVEPTPQPGPRARPTLSTRTRDRLRAGVTLVVLAALLILGVGAGFAALTAPFGTEDSPTTVCDPVSLDAGAELTPAQVTVSVVNAGGRNGLAGQTLDDLETAGFDPGQLADAPEDTLVRGVQIWASDRRDPAVRLVRSHLGGKVRVRDLDGDVAGVTVAVGDSFVGVKQGRRALTLHEAATVCGPDPQTLP